MNTFTNSTQTQKNNYRTPGTKLFHNSAIMALGLALVILVALAAYIANRSTVVVQTDPALSYSNALEMQYAQPWLAAQNKPVVTHTNALELQYAQPWLDKQSKPIVVTGDDQSAPNCQSSIEMLYACKYGNGRP